MVHRNERARTLGQQPTVVWFTGLSGAGKSTIAELVEQRLQHRCVATFVLDGDVVRSGLSSDLGFTDADRVENIRRAVEVAALMADAGLVVLVAFIAPFRAERELARARFAADEFVEVHVDVTLEEAERRDPKGLYARARAGLIPEFTGIDSPYEAPEHPDLRLDTVALDPSAAADEVVALLEARGRLG